MTLIPTSSTNALTLANTTPTAAGLAVLGAADASAQRTALGLGTIATQAASAVAITGGTVSGLTSLALTAAANANPISLTGYSLTGSNAQSLLDLAGTWNTSGTPTALKLNVTDTASGASSLLMDLQVGGGSRFKIGKFAGGSNGMTLDGESANYSNVRAVRAIGLIPGSGWQVMVDSVSGLYLAQSSACVGWRNGVTNLLSDANYQLDLRNSTNAQTFNIYNTYTSSTNYERLTQNWSSNVLYTGAEAGSGGGTKRLQVDFGGAEKALSDGVATGFVRIACANDIAIAGVIHYGVYAKEDSSEDIQIRSGSVNFAIVNKVGGSDPVCSLGTVLNEAIAVTAGTLTVTFDSDTSPGTAVDIRATATSSLTETSLDIRYRVEIFGPKQTVTPL